MKQFGNYEMERLFKEGYRPVGKPALLLENPRDVEEEQLIDAIKRTNGEMEYSAISYHWKTNTISGAKRPGGHTQIIGYENGRYRVYGETLDIGIGNLLDSFGRALGLGFPAGPKIDEMYFEAKGFVELPYSVKGMDLVFSGLQTAAESKIGDVKKEDLCYSLMHTAFAMLTEVSERALAHTEKREILLTGGVAASKALREMLGKMCEERGARLFVPPREVCVDNGAMIAWQGLIERNAGRKMALKDTEILPKQRTDNVKGIWI